MLKFTTVRSAKNLRSSVTLFQNRKTLFQMLGEVLRGKYKMSFLTNLFLILGLFYIISPFDFDWIPVIGWIDDGAVLYLLIRRLQTETFRFIRQKAMARRLDT